MAAIVELLATVGLAVWGLGAFAGAIRELAAATEEVVVAAREELTLRRCAAAAAHIANLRDAEHHLLRIAPEHAAQWHASAEAMIARLAPAAAGRCDDGVWHGFAHREHNPATPVDWPNWRPRFRWSA